MYKIKIKTCKNECQLRRPIEKMLKSTLHTYFT
uniref:Uncharacterized protein n=1 Tax=Lepeophtheirus salmonis TaxID=72036 RepID=A0A0K2VLH6_LEPSM